MLFTTWAHGQTQDEYCATLSDLAGEVQIQKAGENDWLPVEKGMPLEQKDRLKTGSDAYAEILYDDGSIVKMEANSELTLEEVSADSRSKKIASKISLWFGRLLLNIVSFTHSQSRFSVKTPTVVAGVRGTEFVVESLTEEQSDIGVVNGQVSVESVDAQGKSIEGSMVMVQPGFQTTAFKLKKPIIPIPLKEQMLNNVAKIEILRKKALDTRQNLPKIIENRIKTREIIIEKWKKIRLQNTTLIKPKEGLRTLPPIQNYSKYPNRPQSPDKGLRKLPPLNIRKLPPQRSGTTTLKMNPPGTPSSGIKPPNTINGPPAVPPPPDSPGTNQPVVPRSNNVLIKKPPS
jgi:hypothetical protein